MFVEIVELLSKANFNLVEGFNDKLGVMEWCYEVTFAELRYLQKI